jgi:hypothetical protein
MLILVEYINNSWINTLLKSISLNEVSYEETQYYIR